MTSPRTQFDDLDDCLLDDPVSHRGDAQRPQPAVGLGDLDPPHRRRDIALRGQQPSPQRRQLTFLVSREGGDRLPVNPGCSRVGPDLRPRLRQVARLGDGFQHLTHQHHLDLRLSLSPRTAIPAGPPASSSRPAVRPWSPSTLRCCCSLQGLARSAPSPAPAPSQATGPPPDQTGGQRALPRLRNYYEPSDSSEGIGPPFPNGLWHRLPDPHRTADRAVMDHRPPTPWAWRRHARTARDPTRSPWIISSTFSPGPPQSCKSPCCCDRS